jgi:AcrR family transcriptional regulator
MERTASLPIRKIRQNLTRRRLLESLRDQVRQKGVHAVLVRDVVAGARTTRTTFYNHFSGLDAALGVLLDDLWAQTLNLHLPPVSEQRSWRSNTIREWLRGVFNVWDDCKRSGLLPPASLADPHADQESRIREFVKSITQSQSQWSHFTDDEADRRATMLATQLYGALTSSNHFCGADQRDSLLNTLSDIWMTTLESPARNTAAAEVA